MRRSAAILIGCAALATSARGEETAAPEGGQPPALNLTLEDAITQALEKNFAIQIGHLGVSIAQAGVSDAYGQYDPRLTFRYTESDVDYPLLPDSQAGLRPAALDRRTWDYSLGIEGELPGGLTYALSGSTEDAAGTLDPFSNGHTAFAGVSGRLPLLRGAGSGSSFTYVRLARVNRSLSEWDLRAAVINTVTDVVYGYNNLLFAEAQLRSAQRARELAAQLHKENQQRNNVGAMSDYDVLSASARVAEREEAILRAGRFLDDVENRFKQLISDDASAAILSRSIKLAPMPQPVEVVVDPAADMSAALELRPDFRQAELAVKRGDIETRQRRNELLPGVDLVGSYGYSGIGRDFDSSSDDVFDHTYPSYTAGVVVSVPITSYRERARYRGAKLERERADMQLRQLEQDIMISLGNAAGQLDTSWKRVEVARVTSDLSRQTLDAEMRRLRVGTGSTYVVLQLQETLAQNEVREAQAIADYHNALAEYDRQVGRTMQRFHIVTDPSAEQPAQVKSTP